MVPELPKRPRRSHKGDYGKGLLIGGSRGMAGAISLAGQACLKSGAGLLKIATTLESLPIVASFDPCYMTTVLAHDNKGLISDQGSQEIRELAEDSSAIGIGPGMGVSDELVALTTWAYSQVTAPMVFDADALNCLAQNPDCLIKPGGPRILTPHLGELRRLLDDEVSSPRELRYRAESLAREAGVIFVLKGHRSLITSGLKKIQNSTGNSGMATGGSGDVLTGIIVAFLCQKMDVFQAAHLGCLVHGLAGDAGVRRIGKISLTAADIVHFIPKAIRAVRRKERKKRFSKKQDVNAPEQPLG
jgi:ADP-dependent NAD(P)H-hydrate dehydratase